MKVDLTQQQINFVTGILWMFNYDEGIKEILLNNFTECFKTDIPINDVREEAKMLLDIFEKFSDLDI